MKREQEVVSRKLRGKSGREQIPTGESYLFWEMLWGEFDILASFKYWSMLGGGRYFHEEAYTSDHEKLSDTIHLAQPIDSSEASEVE